MAIYRTAEKIIFFAHVPRCGGTSVESHLRRRLGVPAFLNPRHRRNPIGWARTSPQHISADVISSLFPNSFFDHSFAVVRHPEKRLKSVFAFQQKVEKTIPADMTFAEFVEKLRRPRFRNNPQFDNHLRPQSELVPEGAKIFKLEDGLDPVLAHIDTLAGFDGPPAQAPHRLSTKSSEVEVGPEERAVINRIYAKDFERFGYEMVGGTHPGPSETKRLYSFALKTMINSYAKREAWGDWHFASSLADALEKRGHQTRIDCVPDWDRDPEFPDVCLTLCGVSIPRRNETAVNLAWVLYPGRKPRHVDDAIARLDNHDHVMLASQSTQEGKFDFGDVPTSILMQAFDPNVMNADGALHDGGFVFVGTNFPKLNPLRPIVDLAVDSGVPLEIYGPGYDGTKAEPLVRNKRVSNKNLGDLYRGARAVLCDHIPAMVQNGFVSNRIFDALACGAPVICDDIPGLPEEFNNHVFPCKNGADFAAAAEQILSESEDTRRARIEFANTVMPKHSFDARAEQLEALVASLVADRKTAGGDV